MRHRRLILLSLAFLVLLKAIDIGLFRTLAYMDGQRRDDYGNLRKLYNGQINADIVFIGSSRIALQIDPVEIEKQTGLSAYSVAWEGTNFDQHLFTIEEYLLHNRPPKIIVAEADEHILDETIPTFAKPEFRPFIHYSAHTARLFAEDENLVTYSIIRSMVFRGKVGEVVGNYLFPVLATDANVIERNGTRLRNGVMPVDWNFRYQFTLSDKRKQQFAALAALAQRHGSRLVLVATPRVGIFDADAHREARVFLTRLAASHAGVSFFDESENDEIRRNNAYWWGTGHTNHLGATAFSTILGRRLAREIPGGGNR